jgi:hypothetical protein
MVEMNGSFHPLVRMVPQAKIMNDFQGKVPLGTLMQNQQGLTFPWTEYNDYLAQIWVNLIVQKYFSDMVLKKTRQRNYMQLESDLLFAVSSVPVSTSSWHQNTLGFSH